MITINENFKINADGNGCVLIHTEQKSRTSKDTKEVETYSTSQDYHFLTVAQCLNKYVDLVSEPCESVLDVLKAINECRLEISKVCATK